jgi:hypothetical protein
LAESLENGYHLVAQSSHTPAAAVSALGPACSRMCLAQAPYDARRSLADHKYRVRVGAEIRTKSDIFMRQTMLPTLKETYFLQKTGSPNRLLSSCTSTQSLVRARCRRSSEKFSNLSLPRLHRSNPNMPYPHGSLFGNTASITGRPSPCDSTPSHSSRVSSEPLSAGTGVTARCNIQSHVHFF